MKPDKIKKQFIDYLDSKPIEKMRVLNQLLTGNAVEEHKDDFDDFEEF